MSVWIVGNAGLSREEERYCLDRSVLPLMGCALPDLSAMRSLHDLKTALRAQDASLPPESLHAIVEPWWKFLSEMHSEDLAVIALPHHGIAWIVEIAGAYAVAAEAPESLRHQRRVKGLREINLETFSKKTRLQLPAYATLYTSDSQSAATAIRILATGASHYRKAKWAAAAVILLMLMGVIRTLVQLLQDLHVSG